MTLEEFDEQADAADRHLADGEWQQAASAVRQAAEATGLALDDVRLRRLLTLLATIAQHAGIDELHELATEARSLEPQTLYDLSQQLLAVGLERPAATLLARLHALIPGDGELTTQLAMVYGDCDRHEEARDVLLSDLSVLDELLPRYLLCLSAVCALDLDTARAYADFPAPADDTEALMVEHIRGILWRLDELSEVQAPLGPTDLRSWHFAMNGSVLLHLSPYGFDDGMVGRYAYTQDSPGAIRRELTRLVEVLREIDALPTSVYGPPDRGSRIVAGALAAMLGVPMTDDPEQEGSFFVMYASDRVTAELADVLDGIERDQDFVRAVNWTIPPPAVPRYVGLLHQVLIAPWDEQLRVQPDGEGTERVPESDEPDEVWIERILTSEVLDEPEVPPGFDPIEEVMFFAGRAERPAPQWQNGPVRSSRFL